MTALIDWREDANLPTRTFGWFGWVLAIAVALVVAAGLMLAFTRAASRVTNSACRLREGSQGVPQMATAGVSVGQPLPPHWTPGPRIKVRYASGYVPSGVVVDASTCISSDPTELTVVVAR